MAKTINIPALEVDMKGLFRLLTNISPEHSVCIRGRHAIGKSESVYQAATMLHSDLYKDPDFCNRMIQALGGKVKTPNGWVTEWHYDMGLPVIERRLSQMTEGDIIGLPYLHGKDIYDDNGRKISYSSTQFKACTWLINAIQFPSVVFLDERNRALPGVKQAVFQLTDSKAFYGNHLHEESRIFIAENDTDDYSVEQLDPAEISRCATVTLDPTVKDWLNFAQDRCHEATIEFIRNNEKHLECKGPYEANKKYPDRRSWIKFDSEGQRLGLFDDPSNKETMGLLRVLAGSMLGVETSSHFIKFLQERNRHISAKDIITDWSKAKKRLQAKGTISNEQFVECTNKVADYMKKGNELTYEQARQYALFVRDCPPEVVLTCWAAVQSKGKGMLYVHKFIEKILMAAVGTKDYSKIPIPTVEEVKNGSIDSSNNETPTKNTKEKDPGAPKKRGARRK